VGTGKFALPLGIRIGVDPSEKMAEKARLKGISVYSGVAEELPFSEEMFDFVLMVTTICFVDDVFRSFSEAFRVLKPGGAIVVGFIDKESCLGRQYAENKESSRFYKEAVFFSAPEVLGYLEEAGFIIKKILQTLIAGDKPSIIAEGFGKGTFVAIKGLKIKD
jgi:ubiquinone/menaquinone biosynthesis C-methylase UbiE